MHGNLIGIIVSVVLISIGYGIHGVIRKKDDFVARKFLHIWVSNWYFVYVRFFDTPWAGLAGLLSYAVVNLILEIRVFKTHKYGTVYYPVSLAFLVLIQYLTGAKMYALGCAILTMGYADGLAAIVGMRIVSKDMPFIKNKTVAGSVTFVLVAFTVVLAVSGCPVHYAALIAFAAMICEAYVPYGLDNFSVPFAVYLLVDALC